MYYRASIRRKATSGRSEWLCGRSYHTALTGLFRRCPTLTSSPTWSACAPPPAEVTSRRTRSGGYIRSGRADVRGRRTTWWRPAGAATSRAGRPSARLTCSYSGSTPATARSRLLPIASLRQLVAVQHHPHYTTDDRDAVKCSSINIGVWNHLPLCKQLLESSAMGHWGMFPLEVVHAHQFGSYV